jgi:hypothetical protein
MQPNRPTIALTGDSVLSHPAKYGTKVELRDGVGIVRAQRGKVL